ncbi:MAG: efflux RND transporter periplasmic adaptor subunit [Flavobacteriaceae bacterium]|nr:efflux RND transporter periplasmic adaptor subunit [Flavobacteriaceae bacterium]
MKKTIIFLSFIIAVACSQQEKTQETTENESVENTDEISLSQEQFSAGKMELGRISEQEFHNYITTTGSLEVPPQNRADVSAYYGGYVKSLNLIQGQWVNAGQTLFSLENPEFIETQQEYLEAKSQLDFLRQDYERQRILAKEEIVSQKKFQRSQADYNLVRTQVDVLGRKLQMMKINPKSVSSGNLRSQISITAPISGYVSDIMAVKGQFLGSQDVALSIVNTHQMNLKLAVFEKDLPLIHPKMPVEFRLQENPDSIYVAEIQLIGKNIDPVRRTVDVNCKILSAPQHLSSGMFAEARIKTDFQKKYALPQDAVLELEDEKWVLVKESNAGERLVFKKQNVNTGIENENFVEITNTSDFSPQDEILIKGGFQLIQ